jgi:hypothetical protein
MKRAFVVTLLLVSLASPGAFAQNGASQAGAAKYFPVGRVVPGLRGYGMSVFQGTAPERFDVEVLGVLDGMPSPKAKLIIARLSGPNVERTRVFRGMSGSPVYFDGKLAGAVAYSFPFSTEPLAGITPIEQMDAQLRDVAPTQRVSGSRLSFGSMVASRQGKGGFDMAAALRALPTPASVPVGVAATASPQLASVANQQLQPIATPLAFGGFPQSVVDAFAPEFERLGVMAVAGGAGGSSPLAPMVPATEETLRPGSSVSVQLVRGDYDVSASGTVTERDGDRILAFGHPFLSLGATNMPMTESSVVIVVPNVNNSWKMSKSANLVGAIGQDRSSGIGGRLGQRVNMIPVRVSFTNSFGETQTFNYEVIADPNFAPLLTGMTLMATLNSTERQQGDQTIDVKGSIRLDGQPEISLENRFSGASSATSAAAQSIATPLAVLLNSGFKDVTVRGIDVVLKATEERNVGLLTRLLVDKTRVGRGETVTVEAFARTEDGQEFVERIPVEIPRDTPVGKVAVIVGDGASLIASDETLAAFAPENVGQLVTAINKLKKNDRLYVKVVRATGGALVANEPLTSLPPSVLSSLGSPRASGGYVPLQTSTLLDREIPPARFVIGGQQAIVISVVR